MAVFDTTVTNKAIALDAKLLNNTETHFTRVAIGSGSVPTTKLKEQTALTGYIMDITLSAIILKETGCTLAANLINLGLAEDVYIRQVGFYAQDPDEGEILYFIAQADEAIKMNKPTAQTTGHGCEFVFDIDYSTSSNYTANVDPAGFLTNSIASALFLPRGGVTWGMLRGDPT